jgi:hypothetical protein
LRALICATCDSEHFLFYGNSLRAQVKQVDISVDIVLILCLTMKYCVLIHSVPHGGYILKPTHTHTHTHTHISSPVEQTPSCEASGSSASKEILYILWNRKCSLPCSQQPTTYPNTDPSESIPLPPDRCKTHFNIILKYTRRCSGGPVFQVSQPNPRMPLIFLPYFSRAPPITSFLIFHTNNIL